MSPCYLMELFNADCCSRAVSRSSRSVTSYLIVFDGRQRIFGLANWDGDTPVFLGFYGTFLEHVAGDVGDT
jgi:hypothetical protein